MAEPEAGNERQDVIIHLPDSHELAGAKLSQTDIEKLVRDTLGEDNKKAGGTHLGNVRGVTIKGSAATAKALSSGGGIDTSLPNWSKTIWRRACGKKAPQ